MKRVGKEKIKKTIICFTASYPFGTKETYFENELFFLSNAFERIVIIPTYNPYSQNKRKVPENVEVVAPMVSQGIRRYFDFVKHCKVPFLLLKEFFTKRVYANPLKLRQWFVSFLTFGPSYYRFLSYDFDKNRVILYSYWAGKDFFIMDKLKAYKKVIRMHGADFYEERHGGYLPLRSYIYNSSSLLVPISLDISNKLTERYNVKHDKITLSYLGVSNYCSYCTIRNNNSINIVSCSNVYPLKRIHLIYEILSCVDPSIKIRWSHIGEGEQLDDILHQINLDARPNIAVSFLGQKSQEELREIYQNNYFDLFINTSTHEGLPVSIMEAFSYGIPAIATDVGGTSEIVNKKNGILIAKQFNSENVAREIESLYQNRSELTKMRICAYEMWSERFNADANYTKLIRSIDQI